jgi:hypothetical protein
MLCIHSNLHSDKIRRQTRVEEKTVYHHNLYSPGGKNLAVGYFKAQPNPDA